MLRAPERAAERTHETRTSRRLDSFLRRVVYQPLAQLSYKAIDLLDVLCAELGRGLNRRALPDSSRRPYSVTHVARHLQDGDHTDFSGAGE